MKHKAAIMHQKEIPFGHMSSCISDNEGIKWTWADLIAVKSLTKKYEHFELLSELFLFMSFRKFKHFQKQNRDTFLHLSFSSVIFCYGTKSFIETEHQEANSHFLLLCSSRIKHMLILGKKKKSYANAIKLSIQLTFYLISSHTPLPQLFPPLLFFIKENNIWS